MTAVQRWPEFFVAPATARSAARARSSSDRSLSTISGSLPPSSSTVRRYPARSAIILPTATDPVKVMSSTAGFSIISGPISAGQPVTTENISGGSPAS